MLMKKVQAPRLAHVSAHVDLESSAFQHLALVASRSTISTPKSGRPMYKRTVGVSDNGLAPGDRRAPAL